MTNFNQELITFLKNGTCIYTCIQEIKQILINNGFRELNEQENWLLEQNKYFIIRNDASLIAFTIGSTPDKFKIVCTHADTPSLQIKPNPEYYENGYLKLNIVPYGGILNYSFMDRPLAVAGRIIIKKKNFYQKEIIDSKKAIAIIPSIAIHQNDKANSNLDLNTETDLMPIISVNQNNSLEKLLNKSSLFEYDLYLYNQEEPTIINEELLASPRIDNLSCTYAGLKAFLEEDCKNINLFTVYNSEEIGSNTFEGADSNFLTNTLKKICKSLKLDLAKTLSNSFIMNTDNTHASHPNHSELSDHTNTPPLNSGIIIAREINSCTNSVSALIMKHICETNHLKYSYYTSRNDYATGSTLAGFNLKHISINSLDIGLVMLAMHSSYELISLADITLLYQALRKFYAINYQIDNNQIKFI